MSATLVALVAATVFATMLVSREAQAQQIIGQCNVGLPLPLLMKGDGAMFFPNDPQRAFYPQRDPSGQNFLVLPMANPQQVQFVTWQGAVIEVFRPTGNWRQVGVCNIQVPPPPPPPPVPPIAYGAVSIEGAGGMGLVNQMPPGGWRIPREAVTGQLAAADIGEEYVPPLIPTQALTETCMKRAGSSGGNVRGVFMDCVAEGAMAPKQLASYRCMRQSSNVNEMQLCLLRENMGSNEQAVLADVQRCYAQYGTDWRQYAYCLSPTGALAQGVDPKVTRAIQCLQASTAGGRLDGWRLAGCYLGPDMGRLGLNGEAVIALQCAMASGGEPVAFAGCTGGQLAMNELNKCFTVGVGDNGCFGKNNFFTQTINGIGAALGQSFGPNNDLTKQWNDLTRGPGQNHEIVRFANNLTRETNVAARNIEKEVRKVVPRIRIKW
ncbi:hypothetical protein POL68_23330 [Stigmatella sp. ncwal1]|uniref:Conjugal transfer mating pair stabilization protein TraN n=1 Tax=Stigmatella ashevillensis TaxID=2995309 RepID=A0ABT5DF46_9BACT|nr:hypothetical protein [Stigmatella ashevillena]MDC0711423.1 hypothetical protein [Stigmatella ashevillena]